MHELSIAEALLKQVDNLRKTHDAIGVSSVLVRIGCFSGVERDALSLAFNAICDEMAWHDTVLIAEEAPACLRCRSCGTTSETTSAIAICPTCNSADLDIGGGQDMILQRVELLLK